MMKKQVFIIFLAILFLFGFTYFFTYISDQRSNNDKINQDIYVRFREIEKKCLNEENYSTTNKCRLAIKLMQECSDARNECSSKYYYDKLKQYGFILPSFYRDGYIEK